ncbi:MAG: SDR family NAD(P)-dependent oxidoreductase [Endozoicomonas sp.]
MKDFNNKVAVITGAGGGIGRAMALNLAGQGCHLALVDLNPEGLAETAAQLEKFGVNVSQHVANVTDRSRMEALPEEVLAEHGKVNLLMNNAGITIQKSFEDMSLEEWELVIGINIWGVIYGSKAFLPALKKAAAEGEDNAHIINMSSLAGFLGIPNQSSYSATKAAVKGISEALWGELKVFGIGVTTVHPGAIRTNIMRAHMDKAGNTEKATAIADKVEKFAMPVEVGVEKILKAVRKNKLRAVVGKDAHAVELLKRFLPSGIHKPFARMFAKEQAERQ